MNKISKVVKDDVKKEKFVAYLAQECVRIREQNLDELENHLSENYGYTCIRCDNVIRVKELPGHVFGIDTLALISESCAVDEEPIQITCDCNSICKATVDDSFLFLILQKLVEKEDNKIKIMHQDKELEASVAEIEQRLVRLLIHA